MLFHQSFWTHIVNMQQQWKKGQPVDGSALVEIYKQEAANEVAAAWSPRQKPWKEWM